MAGPDTRGSVFRTRKGDFGIRWPEGRKRPQKTGFRTKTDARRWFDEHVAPRLRDGLLDPSITFGDFCDLYLERWGPTVMPRTRRTLEEWLEPGRATFGSFTLRELEGAVAEIAAWRGALDGHARYRSMRALRQVLGAAVRWRFLRANPASATGPNPEPRSDEMLPFTREEIDAIAAEMDVRDAALVVFVAETGLRTNEWTALERRDVDRGRRTVTVQRRYAEGVLTAFPKTERSRRSVPLTSRALDALDQLPPRIDSAVLFPAARGGLLDLSAWRARVWYPALEAAAIAQRGPYHLRHTFATEALAAGVSIFNLARIMGTSVQMIDKTYGHLAADSAASILERLDARAAQPGVNLASDRPQTQA